MIRQTRSKKFSLKNVSQSIQFLLCCAFFPLVVMAQDRPNSQDHPVITRYPGQTIRLYDVKEFDQYNLVLSVEKSGAPENIRKLEGKVTRINYRNPDLSRSSGKGGSFKLCYNDL